MQSLRSHPNLLNQNLLGQTLWSMFSQALQGAKLHPAMGPSQTGPVQAPPSPLTTCPHPHRLLSAQGILSQPTLQAGWFPFVTPGPHTQHLTSLPLTAVFSHMGLSLPQALCLFF